MKVGNVTINYPIHGGVNNSVGHWAAALRLQGATVDVLSVLVTPSEEIDPTENVFLFEAGSKNPFKAPEGFSQHLDASKYDLVFVNGMFNPRTAGVALLLSKKSVPFVMVPHDPYHPDVLNHGRFKKWVYATLIEKKLHRACRAVQVLSESHIKHVHRFSNKQEVIVVGNCIDLKQVPNFSPKVTIEEKSEKTFYYLGRLDMNHKGLDILLRSFAKCQSKWDGHCRLTLQGPDSDDMNTLRNLIQSLGISDSVTILGPDFSKTSYELIGQHDITVLSSRFDGFSYFALEAMLAGVPSVVSEEAGISGHVKESGAGLVCRPTVEDFSNSMLEILSLSSEERNEMGLRGREYAIENLNLEAVGKNALSTYKELIKRL